MLKRQNEPVVTNNGAVFRSTQYALLEGQDYCFQRLHLEFCIELPGSKDFEISKYQPSIQTAPESFFQSSRGIILNQFNIPIFEFSDG